MLPTSPIATRDKDSLRSNLQLQHANLGKPLANIVSLEAAIQEVRKEFASLAQSNVVRTFSLHQNAGNGKQYLHDGKSSKYLPGEASNYTLYLHDNRPYLSNGSDTFWCDAFMPEAMLSYTLNACDL